jgi:hypothetical protein
MAHRVDGPGAPFCIPDLLRWRRSHAVGVSLLETGRRPLQYWQEKLGTVIAPTEGHDQS